MRIQSVRTHVKESCLISFPARWIPRKEIAIGSVSQMLGAHAVRMAARREPHKSAARVCRALRAARGRAGCEAVFCFVIPLALSVQSRATVRFEN